MKKLVVLAVFSVILSLALTAFAFALPVAANNRDETCGSKDTPNFTAMSTSHDLIVPAYANCVVVPGTTIGHDVIIGEGAQFYDKGGYIGHDVTADQPLFIGIGGTGTAGASQPGYVGHDISINGALGPNDPMALHNLNFVCNTNIGHDLTIENSTDNAQNPSTWYVGDADGRCTGGGNQVGHDLNVLNNKTPVDVSDNGTSGGRTNNPSHPGGIGHDLNVTGNSPGYVVEGNVAGHDATCSPAPDSSDGDPTANSAGHKNNGCTF